MEKSNLPKIVIVGRQNVGKSTLFNALVKKRVAIVSPIPGVTRDYIEEKIKIDNILCLLIDTGGLTKSKDKTSIEYLAALKSFDVIKESDLILFMVEKQILSPLDEEIASFIRKFNKNVILVVNKVDNYKEISDPQTIAPFYSLGFENIVPISATHRKNFDNLFDVIKSLLPERVNEIEYLEEIKVAIVGKPNVGKSSVLNSILNQPRSLVSEIPGTTRDSIDTEIIYNKNKLVLIDTAGIRKKSKIKENLEYYAVNRAIKSIKRADIVLLIISSPEGITAQDKKIFYLINEYNKGAIILLNKWDLIADKDFQTYRDWLINKFPLFSNFPILNISALTKLNIEKIFPKILEVYENFTRRIPTNEFNKFIQNIVNVYSPPQEGGVVKIYYGTQFKTKPPSFVLFTNKPDKIKENYKRFLINKIYENFNFEGSPVVIKFRKK